MITYIAYAIENIDDCFGTQYHEYHGEEHENVLDALAEREELDCGEESGIIINNNGEKTRLVWGEDILETEHITA